MKTKLLVVKVAPAFAAAIQRRAAAEDRTMSAFVRRAIERALHDERTDEQTTAPVERPWT